VPLKQMKEFSSYPEVQKFIIGHLSMQFGDVRDMLRLPLPDLDLPATGPEFDEYRMTHACNFAAAAVLCNLISGISVSLFTPPKTTETRKRRGKQVKEWVGTGYVFKELLKACYPWGPKQDKAQGSTAIYDFFRNPFAHALGVHGKAGYRVAISRLKLIVNDIEQKTGLTKDQIQALEKLDARPNWLPAGLTVSGKELNLVVEGFYRDVLEMIRNLASKREQMSAAEARFKEKKFIWREGIPK
jgi:hypothetical protein